MQHISLTPFGRQPVTAALLAARQYAATPPALPAADKWTVFNDLRTARAHFGVTDRDLSVLYALLTFLPGRQMEREAPLVVFPSNASLSERAHGMAESTLRRHLARLVAAGLIWRQDSPNGKRYAARGPGGILTVAFGFDLRPLLNRTEEISRAAVETMEAAEALRRQREALVLKLRDIAKLLTYARTTGHPEDWAPFEPRLAPLRAALRRRLTLAETTALDQEAAEILEEIIRRIGLTEEKTSGCGAHSDCHHTESKPESYESREGFEASAHPSRNDGKSLEKPCLPFEIVLKACPDLPVYSRNPVRNWPDLMRTAEDLCAMLGIAPALWREALERLGAENAVLTISALLQRAGEILNPSAYLRTLMTRESNHGFSPRGMILSLLNRQIRTAA